MAMQMHKVISSYGRCIQHESAQAKVPQKLLWSPLLHGHFTSIDMTMELNQPPHVVNVLVFCDHFMRQVMAYVILDQTAKKLLLDFFGKAIS